jgi:hypothetical protein
MPDNTHTPTLPQIVFAPDRPLIFFRFCGNRPVQTLSVYRTGTAGLGGFGVLSKTSCCWNFSYAPLEIRSTASEPQVLHRPWTSKAICDKQLTQIQFLFIGSLLPLRWANMLFQDEQKLGQYFCMRRLSGRNVFC